MKPARLSERAVARLKRVVFILALIPIAKLIAGGLTDNLGADPVERILRRTGYWTLSFLTITMAVTPVRQLTGLIWLGRFRRMLGLFAFFYACMHLVSYLVLDQFFDWPNILKDVIKRPYITIGLTAFLLLIPLALTSTDKMLKRLGGQRWRKLHRLVYAITFAGVVHFWWLVKKDITEPLIFGVLLVVSLLLRVVYRQKTAQA